MENKVTVGFKDFVEKTGGDPIKSTGYLTIICGCCPCTIACTFMGFYAVLFAFAATWTSNKTGYAKSLGVPTENVNHYN